MWTSLFFGYSFNEAHNTSECWFIQKIRFYFSLSIHCMAWLWNLGFFHVSNSVLSFFSMNKRQLLMYLHPSMNKLQLIMCLHPLMNKWQLTSFHSLKIHHVLAFRWFLPHNQSWSKVCFSAEAYMANRDRGSPMPISACNKERVGDREMAFLSIILLTTIVHWWPESGSSLPYYPANVRGCHISSLQHI